MRARALLAVLVLVTTAPGCQDVDIIGVPPLDPNCEAGEPIIRFTSAPPTRPVEVDLAVTGSVEGFDGLAIHRVVVAGVSATNDGFNFDRWSATIPIATLVSLAREAQVSDGGVPFDQALISVYIVDTCGRRHEQAESRQLRVEVLAGAGVVRDLGIQVDAPGDATFIPADGLVQATVTVDATEASATGLVELTTSRGTFAGAGGGMSTTLVLQRVGMRARASALITSGDPGDLTITARAGVEMVSTTLIAASAPTIFPPGARLLAGQVTLVRVETRGALASCSASRSPGFRVTSMDETVDLTRALLGPDPDAPGMLLIRVEAMSTDEDTAVTLRCEDLFGQVGSAEFETLATAPPEP